MDADNAAELRAAHDGYRQRFGWPTVLAGNRVTLPLSVGICALAVGELLGCDLAAALYRAGCRGPVCAVPGAAATWLFLAECDGTIHTCLDPEVRLLPSSLSVPLPPTMTPHGEVRWIYGPRVGERWLPTCSMVLAMVRTRPGRAG